MQTDLLITLIILAGAILLFLSERFTVDLVALLVLIALGLTRILTPAEVFSGFSDPSVITILSIFVLALGIEKTGIISQAGEFMANLAGGKELLILIGLMLMASLMSLFMNNIAVVSILMPATVTIAKKSNIKLSHLLMPLAFGTLLGGTATLFTTTNLVVNGVLHANGYADLTILDFAGIGFPLILFGILYMGLWGRHMLPKEIPVERQQIIQQNDMDLLNTYQLNERLFRAKIPARSVLIHKKLSEVLLREQFGLNVVAVERGKRVILAPNSDFVFEKEDVMLVQGKLEEFRQLDVEPYLEIMPMRQYHEHELESESVVIVEVVLSPRSQLIGQSLRESQFREKYGMNVLSIWNGKRVIRTGLSDLSLEFGDSLLLQGQRSNLPLLRSEKDFILLSHEEAPPPKSLNAKNWLTIAIFVITILVSILGQYSVSEVMFTGAILMVLFNIVTLEQAYRAIDWRIIFLVAGMLPLGMAMTKTGATSLFAQGLTTLLQPFGGMGLLLGLVVLTVILAQTMKGAAVSAVVAPIAIEAARQFNADPRAMALGVAIATSLAFITPLGHPVNIMMMGPGGYHFRDFIKVGLPLTIFSIIVIMLLLPLFWHLG